ncbi:MAG TPA: XdhC/CoxI family protein [Chloroflexota bacterium]|nr:XdhC/CoxI family protein [Chloroflexota bacterium]
MSEDLRTFFEQVDRVAERGERVAVATIARTKGSTPREPGAKMIIRSAGEALGTVGGGCGEAEVWRTALDVIADGKARMVHVDLTEEIDLKSEGVCGGTLDVFVDAWGPEQRSMLRGGRVPSGCGPPASEAKGLSSSGAKDPGGEAELALLPAIEQHVPVTLATVIERRRSGEVPVGAKLLVRHDGGTLGSLGSPPLERMVVPDAVKALEREQPKTVAYRLGEGELAATVDVLLEPFAPPPEVVILGAGHIAWPLAKMAKLCDFRVTVIDDRASFANRERFPEADRVIVRDVEGAVRELAVTPRTYLVLVTRAHAHDVYALRHLIDKEAAYIGMIGAQRRIWAVFKLLHDGGVAAEKLARVHAPIGVDVGAETPAEIAVSILAEMVSVRRGGPAPHMSDRLRERFQRRLRAQASLEEPDV